MITIHSRARFVFSPHTGSRSLRAALLHVPGAVQEDLSHHTPPDEIPRDLPICAMTRNPFDWVHSYYGRFISANPLIPFEEFLDHHRDYIGRPWLRQRLNVYHDLVDRYYLLEEGLDKVLADLGHPDIPIPEIGKGLRRHPEHFNYTVALRIAQYFGEDIRIYSTADLFGTLFQNGRSTR
jgi:hypothetical protein